MFAIIDIETCGGKYDFEKSRITEICVVLHDGLQVTEIFTTLINPGCYISPNYTRLTGISNEMVADAPKFYEIANKIIDLTKDRIFVAHNVNFDYGFIKEEFASLGYKFKRETLCTVRLSRKLMPGKQSYSLGRLCESIGIEIENRHRAEGDAVATAKLFNMLLDLKSLNPQYRNQGVDELMTTRIDKIKQYILNKLPETCGVYYFLNKDQEIVYIGKSINMYNRALNHFSSKESKSKKMLNDLMNVDFIETGSELIALLFEAEEIKKYKPVYNRMRKADIYTHAIDYYTNEDNIINFKIVLLEDSENPLLSFTSHLSARETLERWVDKNELCLRFCHLTQDTSICFNHQIKKCRGICVGEEDNLMYNRRANKIIEEIIFKNKDFILIDRGKNSDEKSIVVIEDGHYYGYGYIDQNTTLYSFEECKENVRKSIFYPDADMLIRGYLKKNNLKMLVFK
jgi:DNA polymerase III subunit epsilon